VARLNVDPVCGRVGVVRQVVLALAVCAVCACAPSSHRGDSGGASTAAAAADSPTCGTAPHTRLQSGVVFVHPGETVCVRLEVDGDTAIPAELVGSRNMGRVLVLESRAEGPDVFLTVHNPLDRALQYRAGMLLPGEQQFLSTTSCSVLSERMALEHWPHPIDVLALTDFDLLPAGDESMVCK